MVFTSPVASVLAIVTGKSRVLPVSWRDIGMADVVNWKIILFNILNNSTNVTILDDNTLNNFHYVGKKVNKSIISP